MVTGFSQGAVLAYGMAFLRPAMFSAACPMAGDLPPELFHRASLPSVRPEVHGFHGDQDRIVDFAKGRATIDALKRLGFTADLTVIRGVAHKFEPASAGVAACIDRAARKASLALPPR